ncbi:hypothetical protein GCM10007425_12480 [Lysinibacillus alkalisoli]|uniref:Uncharacterized protein n=1 Tax=Lysinibacillus alkalisoli TaxID=1911548 RepID=A0A917LFW7_9BACI|nr:hypothetical protein [Lysinibacillus alkalisoli]GGG19525.1 hypothetical protein GCM10007425_12480 [Lysinibacillus alkalisoli]
MYIYKSCVGTFTIRMTTEGYGLFIGSELLGNYQSAIQAADEVYTHTTGYDSWDDLDGEIDAPTDISAWEPIR